MASSDSSAIVCSPGAMNRCSCSNSWRVRARSEGPDAVRVKACLQIVANRRRRALAARRERRPVVDVDESWPMIAIDHEIAAEDLEIECGRNPRGDGASDGFVPRLRGDAVGFLTMEKVRSADGVELQLAPRRVRLR